MSRARVVIAHQTIWIGDAIGNDIAGAYELLARCGYETTLWCEHPHPELHARFRVMCGADPAEPLSAADLLLYHHSICWKAGEEAVRRFHGPVVVKYHNITPPEFFGPYSPLYQETCLDGRAQTARLAALPNVARWQSDSSYNSEEIGALGVPASRRGVVPPFNHLGRTFAAGHTAPYPRPGPFYALFVGRRAPNKGHAHLLRTIAAWRDLFPEVELRCRVVGATDTQLAGYYRELHELALEIGVADRVEWIDHVSHAELEGLFRSSHLYLNLSEHEGFCVPLVEAQAVGLPLVSTDATAMRETAGPDQLLVPVPRHPSDYDLIAGLAHEICTSAPLRRSLVDAGCRNALRRFTTTALESQFLGDLEPVLASLAS